MATDVNKVIKGLECCHKFGFHEDCPYDKKDPYEKQNTTCMMDLMTDALELLKEQKELLDELEPPEYWIVCKACGHKLRNDWNWCPWCRWEIALTGNGNK